MGIFLPNARNKPNWMNPHQFWEKLMRCIADMIINSKGWWSTLSHVLLITSIINNWKPTTIDLLLEQDLKIVQKGFSTTEKITRMSSVLNHYLQDVSWYCPKLCKQVINHDVLWIKHPSYNCIRVFVHHRIYSRLTHSIRYLYHSIWYKTTLTSEG